MINLIWFLSIILTTFIQIFLTKKNSIFYGIIIPILYAVFFAYAASDLAGIVPGYVLIGYLLPVIWHILIFAVFYLKKEAEGNV